MTEALLYINANSEVPFGRVSSTARKGSKWFDKVETGDVVNLQVTETGETFGQAVIVIKELLTYRDVIENADHNHVAFKGEVNKHCSPARALEGALAACYGRSRPDDIFTVLHILPIGRAAWEFPKVEPYVAASSRDEGPDDKDLSNDSDGRIIAECGDSGERWATEFCLRNPSVDFGIALGWFCNAIEAACDVRRARYENDNEDDVFENLVDLGLDTPGVAAVQETMVVGDIARTRRVEFEPTPEPEDVFILDLAPFADGKSFGH